MIDIWSVGTRKCRINEFFSLMSIELSIVSSYRNTEYLICSTIK